VGDSVPALVPGLGGQPSSKVGESLSGWAAFSAVEALILILSLGTVLLLS